MIEAVNASISTAQSVRAVAQQMTSAESLAVKPVSTSKVSMTTQYTSQYVELAPDIKPIFILRDTDTGESIRQFPTEGQIRAYQRAQQAREAAAQPVPVKTPSTDEAEILVESSVQYQEVRKEIKKAEAPPTPLPGHTKAEVNVDGDTGADVKVKTTFKTDI